MDGITQYDYESLRVILSNQLGEEVTLQQAEEIGQGLIDLFCLLAEEPIT